MLRARAVTTRTGRTWPTDVDRGVVPFDIVVLRHDERHLRRKVLTLQHGDRVLVDLPAATILPDRSRIVLDDGRHVEVIAADEDLLEVRAGSATRLIELAWHIGNRHLPAQLESDRILIGRDHVIRDMLAGLGAEVRDVSEPFQPAGGAYDGHSRGHAGGHHHGHDHQGRDGGDG